MAESFKITLGFLDAADKTVTMSYNHAEVNATASSIKALMSAIIANKEIFMRQPVAMKSAKLIATEETEYSLS